MTRAVYAPGRDDPPDVASADAVVFDPRRKHPAGGWFARYIQGSTTKYAINDGARQDNFRSTLARMYVRVDAEERARIFFPSINNRLVPENVVARLTGDPLQPSHPVTGTRFRSQSPSGVVALGLDQGGGYIDFLIQQAQHTFNEKFAVSETLSDNGVAFFFGQSMPIWPYSGILINTVQDDQAVNMFRLYTEILRGTQMARRQKVVSLIYDAYIVTGVMINLNMAYASDNETKVPFSFQLLVKRVQISKATDAWSPTSASGPGGADLNAVPFDGRPRAESNVVAIAGRTPPGTEEVTPTGRQDQDPRNAQTSPAGAAAISPRPETVPNVSPPAGSDPNGGSPVSQIPISSSVTFTPAVETSPGTFTVPEGF